MVINSVFNMLVTVCDGVLEGSAGSAGAVCSSSTFSAFLGCAVDSHSGSSSRELKVCGDVESQEARRNDRWECMGETAEGMRR